VDAGAEAGEWKREWAGESKRARGESEAGTGRARGGEPDPRLRASGGERPLLEQPEAVPEERERGDAEPEERVGAEHAPRAPAPARKRSRPRKQEIARPEVEQVLVAGELGQVPA